MLLLGELGWKGSSNDSGSFHVFLENFGGKELQYVLIVRVPGSEATNDECIHCD